MRTRKLLSALAIGSMAVFGTAAFGPPDDVPADPPPPAENGCQGVNEASDRIPDDSGESDAALDLVESILSQDDECEDRRPGDAGSRPNG